MEYIKEITGNGVEVKDELLGIGEYVIKTLPPSIVNPKELTIIRYNSNEFVVIPDQTSPSTEPLLMKYYGFNVPENNIFQDRAKALELVAKYFENRLALEKDYLDEIDTIMSEYNSIIEKREQGLISEAEYDKEINALIEKVPEEDRELFLK